MWRTWMGSNTNLRISQAGKISSAKACTPSWIKAFCIVILRNLTIYFFSNQCLKYSSSIPVGWLIFHTGGYSLCLLSHNDTLLQMYNKYYIKDNSYLIFAHKLSDHLLGILPNEKILHYIQRWLNLLVIWRKTMLEESLICGQKHNYVKP